MAGQLGEAGAGDDGRRLRGADGAVLIGEAADDTPVEQGPITASRSNSWWRKNRDSLKAIDLSSPVEENLITAPRSNSWLRKNPKQATSPNSERVNAGAVTSSDADANAHSSTGDKKSSFLSLFKNKSKSDAVPFNNAQEFDLTPDDRFSEFFNGHEGTEAQDSSAASEATNHFDLYGQGHLRRR